MDASMLVFAAKNGTMEPASNFLTGCSYRILSN